MKTLYLECNMGAAGDMLMAALLELLEDREAFLAQMRALGIPGLELQPLRESKCGIWGTRMQVRLFGQEEESVDAHGHGHHHDHGHDHVHDHDHEHHAHAQYEHAPEAHHHATLEEVCGLIDAMPLSSAVRDNAKAVYTRIARAEAQVHGSTLQQVHFHEVGTLDAVADVVGVCLMMELLQPDRVLVSPVCTGFGQVRTSHGVLPVPAPATALLLEGLPVYGGEIRGELCTPTGAALLAHFGQEFGSMPLMQLQKVGIGLGKKDFPAANCVRALWGESGGAGEDEVLELRCNLDDMTPEALSFAQQLLLDAGALDVFTLPIGMKKGRQGQLLTCLCRPGQREEMLRLLFLHTSTLGVRESLCRRAVLQRQERQVETEYGPVGVKSVSGWGVTRHKAEYEDMAAIAREQGLPLERVRAAAEAAARRQGIE